MERIRQTNATKISFINQQLKKYIKKNKNKYEKE
jgi:hypothetical protein